MSPAPVRGDAADQVQARGALVGCDGVPPTAREVQHVARVEDQVGEGISRRRFRGLDIAVHRLGPGRSIDAPALGAIDLDHDHVVVVAVDLEPFGGRPARVHVHLNAGAQPALQPGGEVADGLVQLVDRVEHQGCALGQAGVQLVGVDPVPHGAAANGDGLGVAVLRQCLVGHGQAHAGRFQAGPRDEAVEGVEGEQGAWVVGRAADAG